MLQVDGIVVVVLVDVLDVDIFVVLVVLTGT
jgi:hypothetical protein